MLHTALGATAEDSGWRSLGGPRTSCDDVRPGLPRNAGGRPSCGSQPATLGAAGRAGGDSRTYVGPAPVRRSAPPKPTPASKAPARADNGRHRGAALQGCRPFACLLSWHRACGGQPRACVAGPAFHPKVHPQRFDVQVGIGEQPLEPGIPKGELDSFCIQHRPGLGCANKLATRSKVAGRVRHRGPTAVVKA